MHFPLLVLISIITYLEKSELKLNETYILPNVKVHIIFRFICHLAFDGAMLLEQRCWGNVIFSLYVNFFIRQNLLIKYAI